MTSQPGGDGNRYSYNPSYCFGVAVAGGLRHQGVIQLGFDGVEFGRNKSLVPVHARLEAG